MAETIEGDLTLGQVYLALLELQPCQAALRLLIRLGRETPGYKAWQEVPQEYRDWMWGVLPRAHDIPTPKRIHDMREAAHRDFDEAYSKIMDAWVKQDQEAQKTLSADALRERQLSLNAARIEKHDALADQREKKLAEYEQVVNDWMLSPAFYRKLLAYFKTLL